MIGGSVGSKNDPYRLDLDISSLDPPGRYRNTSGRTLVDPRMGARTAVMIFDGQSNNSNNVAGTAYAPTNGSAIFNLNACDGGVYLMAEPTLGCGGNRGSMPFRIADRLITSGKWDRVICVTVAVGSTTAANHADATIFNSIPGINAAIGVAAARLAAVGLVATHVVWVQGEADQVFNTTTVTYTAALNNVIACYRAAGVTAKFYVALRSKFGASNPTGEAQVRAGQAAVCNGIDVIQGPDTDTITAATGHWDATEAPACADLWTPILH